MNRLAHEKSAYLRQHAENPVDWYPWGDEALSRARAEQKPILLSVGYSACHWCHVMAHESFEDPETAGEMNARFINIKVDREERPDVDQLYQGVVQLMGRGGGWPLTVFLTPDLRPFYGGTYFPREDRYGLPSFRRLLGIVHDAFVNRPDDIEAQAKQFVDGLQYLGAHGLDAPRGALTPGALVAAARAVHRQADPVNGGFGRAPKFPSPMNVQLLLRGWRRGGGGPGDALWQHVALTLDKMAKGGLFDQLGGGFHRYSVDERWLVPHFEKMLYDNAQLLHLYSEASRLEQRPLWKRTVEETVAYVAREMTAPGGAFYATQDADSEGEEGKFFVWRPAEVDALLPPEDAALVKQHLGITPQGNFEHGATVLELVADAGELARRTGEREDALAARLARARAVLFAAREKRVKPGRDEKLLAGWNGLMIRGLSAAAATFDRPDWARLAAGAADFVLEHLWDGKRLRRLWQDGPASIDGFIDDYGALAAGLTALYQVTFEPRYVAAAEALADRAVELFWDAGRGAYLSAPRGQKDLIAETFALHDNATPSGASSLTEAHVALAALTGRARHLEQAERYLTRLAEPLSEHAPAYGHLWLAADAFLDGAAEVTVVGDEAGRRALLEVVRRAHAPTLAVVAFDPAQPVPEVLAEVLRDRAPVEGRAAAYVCRHFACERPTTDPSALDQALRRV